MALLKRILRYIKGTTTHGLQLRATADLNITAYSDADWAGCPDTRRSTSGFCVCSLATPWSHGPPSGSRRCLARVRKLNTAHWQTRPPSVSGYVNCWENYTAPSPKLRWHIATTSLPYTCRRTRFITRGPNTSNLIYTFFENECRSASFASYMFQRISSTPTF
jgi:hypothetical protein